MENRTISRDEAINLFKQYNQSESLYKHALSVEAVMRFMAIKFNEDANRWAIVGLLHDLDYEKFPEQHCTKTKEILEQHNFPEDIIRAIMSHGWQICTDVEPKNLMEKTLYAVDELTGLVTTSALVRPSKSVLDLTAKSVKKKWNDKRFAAGVDRSIIERGAQLLEIELNELIENCIEGMKVVAEEIGLK